MQTWPQFKEGNGVDYGKVAASMYISVQWKAYREWRIAMWHVFFLSDDNLQRQEHSQLKQRRDEDHSPCLHIQASFLISWPAVT